ncbi:MAG: hypothetical protein JNM17_34150 [Archangium sp.]|nr:hypothetical protein [Archangium sp.]
MSPWLMVLLLTASEERRPTSVSFEAPAGCPGRERFEQELVFRTTRVRLVSDADATARIEVKLSEAGRRFMGQLTVRTADGKNITKQLKGPKCESVTAALSLAAALVLDPEGTNTAPLPASLPAVVVEPEPPMKPEPSPELVTEPQREPTVVVPQTLEPPKVVEPQPASSSSAGASIFALGVMSTTVSGALDFGGGAGGEFLIIPSQRSPLRIVTRLGLTLTSGRTVTSAAGSAAWPLGVGGVLGVGGALQLSVVRPELGLSAQLTSLSISGLGTDQNLTSQRWLLAAGPYARVTLALGNWLVAVEGMLGVTAIREQYRVDPDGLVFQVPPLGAVAQVQVGRSFSFVP